MQRLKGLDAYLTPKDTACEVSDIVLCRECGFDGEVECDQFGDERYFTCPCCHADGVMYWHDEPDFRGWSDES